MDDQYSTLDYLSMAVHRIKTNELPKDEYQEILNMIISNAQSLLDESGGE